jgi:hypothetical protein
MEEKSQLIHVGIPLQTGKKYSALMIEMEWRFDGTYEETNDIYAYQTRQQMVMHTPFPHLMAISDGEVNKEPLV